MPAREPGQATATAHETTRRLSHVPRYALWLPAVACVIIATGLGAWTISGGHVLVMRTPSMGTTAPAGSLVLTRPLDRAALHQGMIVAFRVPNTGEVYMHRIAALLPDGSFRTRGDLDSSDDGWMLTRGAIVGVPVLIAPLVGWLVLCLPWALAVLVAGAILVRTLPHGARPSIRSLTIGGAIALPIYLTRPFVRATITSAGPVSPLATASQRLHAPAPNGATNTAAALAHAPSALQARLVNGGVLPLRVTLGAAHTTIHPGHAGIITAHLAGRTLSTLAARATLPWWGYALLAALMLTPLPVGLLSLREQTEAAPQSSEQPLSTPPRSELSQPQPAFQDPAPNPANRGAPAPTPARNGLSRPQSAFQNAALSPANWDAAAPTPARNGLSRPQPAFQNAAPSPA